MKNTKLGENEKSYNFVGSITNISESEDISQKCKQDVLMSSCIRFRCVCPDFVVIFRNFTWILLRCQHHQQTKMIPCQLPFSNPSWGCSVPPPHPLATLNRRRSLRRNGCRRWRNSAPAITKRHRSFVAKITRVTSRSRNDAGWHDYATRI